jgi:hypothetical protein
VYIRMALDGNFPSRRPQRYRKARGNNDHVICARGKQTPTNLNHSTSSLSLRRDIHTFLIVHLFHLITIAASFLYNLYLRRPACALLQAAEAGRLLHIPHPGRRLLSSPTCRTNYQTSNKPTPTLPGLSPPNSHASSLSFQKSTIYPQIWMGVLTTHRISRAHDRSQHRSQSARSSHHGRRQRDFLGSTTRLRES